MILEQLQAMSDEELNELSAVKVMGYDMRPDGYFFDQDGFRVYLWRPCTDMNDAIELANKLKEEMTFIDFFSTADSYNVVIDDKGIVVQEEKAPRAITIAAILAKGE